MSRKFVEIFGNAHNPLVIGSVLEKQTNGSFVSFRVGQSEMDESGEWFRGLSSGDYREFDDEGPLGDM